jgi:hypothetical protein
MYIEPKAYWQWVTYTKTQPTTHTKLRLMLVPALKMLEINEKTNYSFPEHTT